MSDDPEDTEAEDVEDETQTESESESDQTSMRQSQVPIGVKLGSTRTIITVPEPDGSLEIIRALTCVATYEDVITGEEKLLYGEEAANEYPDRVEFMLRSGLPEDDESADLAKRYLDELVEENGVPDTDVVVYAVPNIDNEEGLERLEEIVEESEIGGDTVRSYPESFCGAIPAFGEGLDAVDKTFIAVNLGSTNLEANAYRRGEQISPLSTGAVTGNEADRRIANLVEEETQGRVNIDLTTAREYKEEHADFDDFEPFTDVIQQPGGGSHEFTIERSVMDAVNEYLDDAVDEVANNFLPQLANDHMKVYQNALDEAIVLTGGMACIPGIVDEFEERLSDEIQRDVDVIAADRPDLSAAQGAYRIAERLSER